MSNEITAAATPPAAHFLFPDDVMERIKTDEANGIYTAERCPEDKRNAIIQLRGSGSSKRRVMDLLKVHRLTIIAIEEKFPEDIETVRQRTVRKMRRCVTDQLERVEERPDIIPPNSIAQFIGVLSDKAELMDGRATARVEHLETVDIYGDWDQFVEKQLEPENVREIDALRTPEIGLGDGKTLPIESGSASDAVIAERVRTDGGSEDRVPITRESASSDPTSVTSLPTDAQPNAEAERAAEGSGTRLAGGGSAPAGPSSASTGNSSQKISANRSDDE